MQRKREHGLCFNCSEQFTLGHRCRTPQLFILEATLVESGETILEEEVEGEPIEMVQTKAT